MGGTFGGVSQGRLPRIPKDATHLLISVGGNNALSDADIVHRPAHTAGVALHYMTEIRQAFRSVYRAMLYEASSHNLPLAVCTIYDAVPGLPAELQTALCLYNDAILREAMALHIPVIDLRGICTEPEDYSAVSPIEPSLQGGEKIAAALIAAVG